MRVRKRLRRIKRLGYLGALAGGVLAARRAKARRDARTHLGAPATWPPLQPAEPPVAALGDLVTDADHAEGREASAAPAVAAAAAVVSDEPVAAVGAVASDPPTWVAPDDQGGCPLTHPIKANGNSGIYHVPGGAAYGRTRAERCYADAAAAEADGYRAAKGS